MGVVPANPPDARGDVPGGRLEVATQLNHPQVTNKAPEPASGRFQILALDGGGAKALFTPHVLARLEQDLGVSINDSFDLIAGHQQAGSSPSGWVPASPRARSSDTMRNWSRRSFQFRGDVLGGARAN